MKPEVAATAWRAAATRSGGFRSEARIRDLDPVASDEPLSLNATAAGVDPRDLSVPHTVQLA
ncbi:MAG: hypothetical protein D6683_04590 [Actinomyces sp.]|nr:MAG: hypothetical protein D6683_04590 [Actinomyces sp.]